MRYIYFLFFTCWSALLTAQSFGFPRDTSLFFPISATTAQQLIDREIQPEDLPEPARYYGQKVRYDTLPPGHYLRLSLKKDELLYEHFTNYRHVISTRKSTGGHLKVSVVDAEGQVRTDATVLANGKPVRYQQKHRAYRRRDWQVNQLTVIIDQDTLYRSVEEEIYRSRLGHHLQRLKGIQRRDPIFTLLSPIHVTRSMVRSLTNGIFRGRWRWPRRYPLQRTIRAITRPRSPSISGYVSTSQPKYRPGDTLRLSAYLASRKGKPLKDEFVSLTIHRKDGYRLKQVKKINIPRSETGRYNYKIAIPADWKLDTKYEVRFSNLKSKYKPIGPSITFELEDYELPEYELNVAVTPEANLPNSAWVDVTANDVNGMALPAGEIEFTVLLKRFGPFTKQESISLPDTLYHLKSPTGNQLERRLIVPDSVFPTGYALDVQFKVQLTGPSGEYKEFDHNLRVDRRYPFFPYLEISGDSLLAYLKPATKIADAQTAVLETIGARGDTLRRTVSLPYAEAVDHTAVEYRLRYDVHKREVSLRGLQPFSATPISWSRDTLRLAMANPYGQEIHWALVSEDGVLAEGDEFRLTYVQSGFAPGAILHLEYRYLASGQWHAERRQLTAPRYDLLTADANLLDIAIDQPETVRPGQTVRVSVQATDQRGKPAEGVRFTAGSYNARFNGTPVTSPTYETKRVKEKRPTQEYELSDRNFYVRGGPPPLWVLQRFAYDTLEAFRLRYPAPEYSLLRSLDTIVPEGRITAHVAPFVIKDNELVTVRTVHADDRLVYAYFPNVATPYSIPVDSGLHRISLRTNDYRYEKKLYLPARQQLVVSFDAKNYAAAGWTRKRMKEWTDNELRSLLRQTFALAPVNGHYKVHYRDSNHGILQEANVNRRYSWHPIGLAAAREKLTFWLPSHDSVFVEFEPGAAYRITKGRDRLYDLDEEKIYPLLRQRVASGPQSPGVPRYAYPYPVLHPRPRLIRYLKKLKRIPPVLDDTKRSRLQLSGQPPNTIRTILAPTYEDVYLKVSSYEPKEIKVGTYDLLFHCKSDSVFQQRITLNPHELRLQVFNRSEVTYYASYDSLYDYSYTREEEPEPLTYMNFDRFGGKLLGKVIDEETGEPLIGVSIQIRGTQTGTVTDMDGEFNLKLPDQDFTLKVSYTGYVTTYHKISLPFNENDITITIAPDNAQLEEVVVIGYGVQRKSDRTKASVTISADQLRSLPTRNVNQIAGITAGVGTADENGAVNIRGSRSDGVDYYVDGVRIRGASSLSTEGILYVVDGVVQTDISAALQGQLAGLQITKSDEMTALYGSRAANGVIIINTKDKAGKVVLRNLAPLKTRQSFADYAAYHPELMTDDNGRAVFNVTFPDDITAWNTFVVGQDRKRRVGFNQRQTTAFLPLQAQLYLPRFLVAGDRSEAATLAINRGDKPLPVRLTFSGDGVETTAADSLLTSSIDRRYPLTATDTDSLTYRYTLQSTDGSNEADGEERQLPVYPKGTEMLSGSLFNIGTEPAPLPADFARPERGDVYLQIYGNRVEQLLNDVDHIVTYPYACMEQTASRLIGLLALRDIRRAEGKPFTQNKTILTMIARLQKMRRSDGGYGWWPGSRYGSTWITQHVFRALSAAEQAEFEVGDLGPIRRYLLSGLSEKFVSNQLDILLTLGEEGDVPTAAEVARLDTLIDGTDYQFLALHRLRQLRGDTVATDSLLRRAGRHALLGLHWGKRGYHFYRQPVRNRLASNLLAYRILREAGRDSAADASLNYLLGQSPTGTRAGSQPMLGTNTLESAILVRTLIPDLLAGSDTLQPPSVELLIDNASSRITAFPHEQILARTQVPGTLISKRGSGPVVASLHQRWFEKNPVATDGGFQLSTRLLTPENREINHLTRGETAYLEITVEVSGDSEYVLIEAPIPAGCSYHNRDEFRGRYVTHREYQRDRVALFCDKLPQGTYVYKVALAPRFSGKYTLNPARAEMQYVPAVHGNGDIRAVEVE